MKNIEIYLAYFDERTEIDGRDGGYLGYIYVGIDGNYYELSAYEPVRFRQDFDRFVEREGYFYHKANTIFVPEVTREHIINTILHLAEPEAKNFFSALKPLDPEEVKKLDLTKVYPKEE